MFGSFFGAHGAGYFLSDLGHADFLFGGVVGEGDGGVVGEFEVVGFPSVDAAGQGSVFAAESAGGVVAASRACRILVVSVVMIPGSTGVSGRAAAALCRVSSAWLICCAQHQAPVVAWWWSVTACSSRSRCALHRACRAAV